MWFAHSTSLLHWTQISDPVLIPRLWRATEEGILHIFALHTNVRTFSGAYFSYSIQFNERSGIGQIKLALKDLVEKIPVESSSHIQLSHSAPGTKSPTIALSWSNSCDRPTLETSHDQFHSKPWVFIMSATLQDFLHSMEYKPGNRSINLPLDIQSSFQNRVFVPEPTIFFKITLKGMPLFSIYDFAPAMLFHTPKILFFNK